MVPASQGLAGKRGMEEREEPCLSAPTGHSVCLELRQPIPGLSKLSWSWALHLPHQGSCVPLLLPLIPAWGRILSWPALHLLPILAVPHAPGAGREGLLECGKTCPPGCYSCVPLSLPRGHGANKSGDMSSILQEARLAPCTSQEQLLPAVAQMLAMGHQDGIGKRMWTGRYKTFPLSEQQPSGYVWGGRNSGETVEPTPNPRRLRAALHFLAHHTPTTAFQSQGLCTCHSLFLQCASLHSLTC